VTGAPANRRTAAPARVLVAMSGGVDSSVAAALLVEQGYDVVGATMKLFCYGDGPVPDRPCCSVDSIFDARAVADRLGVPHYTLNLEDRFGRDVVANFVSEYGRGRTPIPCVRCNSFTKFSDLLAHADALDCEFIATGHYARASEGRLLRGLDRNKDQSYFLWGIRREVVARMLTPVGHLTKPQTRDAARRLGLATAEKPESQEICFVPDGDYAAVLAKHMPADAPALSSGSVVTTAGEVIGEHDGFARFTIGQRKGLPGGRSRPLHVVAIRPETREVVVGNADELARFSVELEEVNWLAEPLAAGEACEVQVRHRSTAVRAVVQAAGPGTLSLSLLEPARAVAPGQSGVIYRGEHVLGGGVIA
jgi:tRNA-specific 2-thiouridylase